MIRDVPVATLGCCSVTWQLRQRILHQDANKG
jgi:hypothetical protein